MSWKAAGIVKALTHGLTRSEKLVLLILADYYNEEDGRCDPSLKRLADEGLLSTRQTIRLLDGLEAKGFLIIVQRREDGHQASNQYDLICLKYAFQRRLQGDTVAG